MSRTHFTHTVILMGPCKLLDASARAHLAALVARSTMRETCRVARQRFASPQLRADGARAQIGGGR